MKRHKCSDSSKKVAPVKYSKKDMHDGVAPEGVYLSDEFPTNRCIAVGTHSHRQVLFISDITVEGADRDALDKCYTLTDEKFYCSCK